MEFPPEWTILPAEDFSTAVPRDPGDLGMDLLVQVRSTGRMIDHFRVALGGTVILNATFTTKSIFLLRGVPELQLKMDVWPNDIQIRRNMTTSEWVDISSSLAANDIISSAPGNDNENEDFMAFLTANADKANSGASIRWGIGVSADGKLELNLEGFPASSVSLMGKPTFRG